jgi:hypothetical protein
MSWAILLEAADAVRAAAAARDARAAGLPLAGIGWATVEHERAIRELDALLAADRAPGVDGGPGPPHRPWTAIGRDSVLGAQGWVRDPGAEGERPALVVLEPDTEGRLAASLARFGEGVAVAYLGDGPPGPGALARGGAAWGPHAVLLGRLDPPGPLDPGER